MSEDEGSIFSNLPRPRGQRDDDDADRRARSRAWMAMRNANQEGPLRPRPSGVGGPSIGQGTTPATTSVWSAEDAAATGMTLSNGGLTVTDPTGGGWTSIRSSISRTTGKLYVEILVNASNNNGLSIIGLASAGFNPTGNLGASTYSAGIVHDGNYVSAGFISNYNVPQYPITNDVWALAVDFAAGSVWVAQNNVWLNSSNPATGSLPIISFTPATVGALFCGLSLYYAGEARTLQATPASQKYAPPSGFSPWG
jgi:hypothetical protein